MSTNTINVTIDGIQALSSQYEYKNVEDSTKGYTRKTGQIEFSFAPTKDSTVVITYNRSLDLLNAAERIQFLYEAQSGLYGKDFAQLMDGVDYGGVQVKSFEFGAKLGWDNDPWYATTWDSYDDGFEDEIITLDGSTTQITLSKPLENEVVYNVYLNGVRIDDPNFGTGNPVANPNAITQSLTGDGEKTIIYTDNDGLDISKPLVDGDTIIVRKASSDGSFLPDTFTLDTVIEGGNLAYGTATGLKSEDITIDGDGFVTPTTSKGPEELVTGPVSYTHLTLPTILLV